MENEKNKLERLPLIPMQEGMLFHSVSSPNLGVDVQQISMTLNEGINVDTFRSAWESIIERHAVLRFSFEWEDVEKPEAVLHNQVSLPITELDWSQLSTEESEDQFNSLKEIDRLQGFDLKKPPLMRITIIHLKDSVTRCLWSFHHIILDGRSFPKVIKEVFQIYDSMIEGGLVSLPDTFAFTDFVRIVDTFDHTNSAGYWQDLLKGFSEPTPLGLSHSTYDKQVAGAIDNQSTFLSEHVAQNLNNFARDIGVTLNTLVQAAWGLLLSHYSGKTDVVFGNTRSGRNLYEPASESVGLFINTVPVRVQILPEQTLVDFLRELRAQHIAVREHESTPLNFIQKLTDVPAGSPLFNTLVVFENYDLNNALRRNGGKWLKRRFVYQGQTSFPLTLMAYADSKIMFRMEYDPSVYSADTVGRILSHLKTLLQKMAERPYVPALSVPFLSVEETDYLLKGINPDLSSAGLERTVFEMFIELADQNPRKIALINNKRTYTYRELSDRVCQLSRHLKNLNVKTNNPVGICLDRSADMVISMLAVLGSGGAFVPLDPKFPKDRLNHMIVDSGMEVLITEADILNNLPMYEGRIIMPSRDRDEIFSNRISPPRVESRIDGLAYIIYTSGSTGLPKGVQIPHRALMNFMLAMKERPGLSPDDVLTAITTISFDISILEILLPLMTGATVNLVSDEVISDGRELAKQIESSGTTVMQATPATWRMLIDSGWKGSSQLRILCGGEKLTNALASELLKRSGELWNMYGPTETTIWSLISKITADTVKTYDPLPIGRPVRNTLAYVLDDNQNLLPLGSTGELCLGGQGVSLGYRNRNDLSSEKFLPNPFGSGQIYRTGDVAGHLDNGQLVCYGRKDNQLKIRGFRIEPGEIESAMITHASVKEIVAAGHELESGETQLVAYVILEDGALATVSELRKYASTHLVDYMVPTGWVFMDHFPMTNNNKIDRNALPAPTSDRPELENAYVAPKSATEKEIAGIWESILNVNKIGVHDNFFDVGGDSLLVVRVLSRLRGQFGSKIAVHDLYAHRTIRRLAEKLDEMGQDVEIEEVIPEPVDDVSEVPLPPLVEEEPEVETEAEPEEEPAPEPEVEEEDDGFDLVMMNEEPVPSDPVIKTIKPDPAPAIETPSELPPPPVFRVAPDPMPEPSPQETGEVFDLDFSANADEVEAEPVLPVEPVVGDSFALDFDDDSTSDQEDMIEALAEIEPEEVDEVVESIDDAVEEEPIAEPESEPMPEPVVVEPEESEIEAINFDEEPDEPEMPEIVEETAPEEDPAAKTDLGPEIAVEFQDDGPDLSAFAALEEITSTIEEVPVSSEYVLVSSDKEEEEAPVSEEELLADEDEEDQDGLADSDTDAEIVDEDNGLVLEGLSDMSAFEALEDITTFTDEIVEDDMTDEIAELAADVEVQLEAEETVAEVVQDAEAVLEAESDSEFEAIDFDEEDVVEEIIEPEVVEAVEPEPELPAEIENIEPEPAPIEEETADEEVEIDSDAFGSLGELQIEAVGDLELDSDDDEGLDDLELTGFDDLDSAGLEAEEVVFEENEVQELLEVESAAVVTDALEIPEITDLGAASFDEDVEQLLQIEDELEIGVATTDIAIIGMSGRFPGAKNLDEFWNNLANGVEGLRHLTEEELRDVEIHYDEYKKDSAYVPATGLLDDVDMFDAAFFGIKPVEARTLDPQQRLWFETSWETLENAGYDPARFNGNIGVFAGSFMNSYVFYNLLPDRETIEDFVRLQAPEAFMHMINNERDYMPTRTAYLFDLKGPAINVQTACSTSLVSISLACRSILAGESDMALAGGVAIFLPQERGYFYQEGGMRSADGHCRPFDDKASGTVFASGLGCVLLKKLDRALEDGDNVLAVVKGTALNNDGTYKASYTAPSIEGQASVIEQAMVNADVDPDSISYIEAHGTATPLGDPIEIAGLQQAYADRTDYDNKIALGAVKSNIGHLDAAAGIAGVIKTVLALQNEMIPPTLHYENGNSEIDFENSPFFVADKSIDWPANPETPRRAGISSFGVGGTNAHAILEEAPLLPETTPSRGAQLLMVSAKSADALQNQVANLANWLEAHPNADLADVAFTLTFGRAELPHRCFVVATDVQDAIEKLRGKISNDELRTAEPEIVFMFPGQGAQFVGMGRELYESEPVFEDAIDHCAEILSQYLDIDIRDVLYPINADDEEAAHKLKQTGLAQPAIFAVTYAQVMLWQSWGITPDMMVGHSVGEFVAATIAGTFSLQDALKIIAGRAKLMQELPGGSMLAVRMSEEELAPWLEKAEGVSIAAVNAPSVTIVSGSDESIQNLVALLEEADEETIELHTSHAFHSSMMDPILEPFEAIVQTATLNEPFAPIVSTLTGQLMTDEEITSSPYWTQQLRQAVRFSDAVKVLLEDSNRIFLEVGPGTNLSGAVRQHLTKDSEAGPFFVIDSLGHASKQLPALSAMLDGLGKLWMAGAEPDFGQYYAEEKRRRVPLPTYPFERKRFWVDPPEHKPAGQSQQLTNNTPALTSTVSAGAPVENSNTNGFHPVDSQESTPLIEINTPLPKESVMGRNENIRAALVELLNDLSGIEIGPEEYDTSFPELGFDSLTLTQVSSALRKHMSVTIRFRKLLEDVATINDLTEFCADALPEDAYASAPAQPAQSASQAPAMQTAGQMPMMQMPDFSAMADNPMQMQMMQMQQMMMLMQQQMAMLGQGNNPAAAAAMGQTAERIVEVARKWPKAPEKKDGDSVNKVTFGPYKPIKKGAKGKLTDQQSAWLEDFMTRLQAKTPTSKKLAQENRDVQADPRTVAGFRQTWKEIVYQIATEKSKGSRIWDVDGNEYVDITMGFGVGFLGHSPDFVVDAVREQLDRGIEIGPQQGLAGDVARMVREITGMERVSFCNTGSEAIMAAMRMARTITGRDKIVYFSGDYHGVFDEVLARPQVMKGNLMTVPAAPGITEDAVANAIILDYGTDASLEFIREHSNDIAAVIIETVQSRHPENRPHEFVKELRKITTESGSALVFDEVITGFRVHQGGMQKVYGVEPDISCYGKIIGGGIPIGVVAGSKTYMDTIDGGFWQYGDESIPEVDLTFFAGTFVRHPMALAAAKAVCTYLLEKGTDLQDWMNERTANFAADLNEFFEDQGVPIKINHYSSWFRVEVPVEYPYPDLLFYSLLEKGVYVFTFAQNCFFSIAHTDEDIEFVKQAFKDAVLDLQKGGFLPVGGNSQIPFPLTEAQKEIWLASQLSERAATSYNEGFSIHLTGKLDVEALKRSITTVIRRHGSLHLRFSPDGDGQTPAPKKEFEVDFVDISAETPTDAKIALATRIDKLMLEPFDLAKGPLVKCSIVRISPTEHLLLWVANHIVYDGWSAVVVISEIRDLYNGQINNQIVDLEPVDNFRDYVNWEQEATSGEFGEEVVAYWKERFSTVPKPIDLPYDYPRPASRSFGASSIHFNFKGDLVNQIKQLAQSNKTSTFVVMLAAFKAMLYHLSRSEDLVVGIHTAGQAQAGLDNLVGHAVSILPIRSAPNDEISFTDFIDQVKDSFLDAQDHQPFTFGKLLQNLNIPRDTSRSPLVDIVFNLDKKLPEDDFVGLKQAVREIPKQSSNWDMFMNLYEEDGTLKADVDYNVDLFKRDTVAGWLDGFELLLKGLVEEPTGQLGSFEFFTDSGLSDELDKWNNTASNYPADLTLPEIISRQAAQTQFKPALIDNGQTYSYKDVDQRVALIAGYLKASGVTTGSIVGLCLERSADMVMSALAIMRAGGAYVPIDPDYPEDRIQHMIADSGMTVAVTQASVASNLPSTITKLVIDDPEDGLNDSVAPLAQSLAEPEGMAYMIYTSGSSGLPKGVMVPHRALTNFMYAMKDRPGIASDDILLSVTTMSFDIAALEIYLPLIVGARVAIARPEVSTDGNALASMIESIDATMMQATPATWKLLIDSGWAGKSGLKILCGGEALSRSLANSLLERCEELWNMYGPTETTIWSTVARVVPSDDPISIGRPIANTQVYVLSSLMRPVPVGVEGELYIGGDGVAFGYFNRPELTADRFVKNPFGDGKLYRTGDLAKYNDDGTLICLGRTDNQVKIRGFRIELEEIEAILLEHPSITDAVAIVREDTENDKRIVAYTIQTDEIDPATLRGLINEKLPYYMMPSAWMKLDEFPKTPNGKIDRNSFPEPLQDRSVLESSFEPAKSDAEKHLLTIWCDVLRLDAEQIGINDNFFELGGHSLLATRVINRLKETSSEKISLLTFFDNPTIAGLASNMSFEASPESSEEMESDRRSDDDREEFVI